MDITTALENWKRLLKKDRRFKVTMLQAIIDDIRDLKQAYSSKWEKPWKTLFTRMLKQHASPLRQALAVYTGIMIGLSPFLGFHLAMSIFFSYLLGLNKMTVYAAANISIPIFFPFLTLLSYQIGYYILEHAWLPLSWNSVEHWQWIPFRYWMLGSLILGCLVGLPSAGLTYLALKIYEKHPRKTAVHTPFESAQKKALRILARQKKGFWRGYLTGKLKWDRLYRQIFEKIPPKHRILDLGGGAGLITLLHQLNGNLSGRTHTVVDHDPRKIQYGHIIHSQQVSGSEFLLENVLAYAPSEKYDTIVLADLLHYFCEADQMMLLQKSLESCREQLIIRALVGRHFCRTWLTLLLEKTARHFKITLSHQHLHPVHLSNTITLLKNNGFLCKVEKSTLPALFSNLVITAQKIKCL